MLTLCVRPIILRVVGALFFHCNGTFLNPDNLTRGASSEGSWFPLWPNFLPGLWDTITPSDPGR